MDMGNAASNTNTFEPSSDLIQEEDCNTLVLYLPGFTKEQLRVQLTRTRLLKISGTRPIGNNKWSSFQKDFPISENCDTNKITAKFEDGILYVRQPKLIVPADQHKKAPETPQPDDHKHAADEPRPAAKINDQPTTNKTTPATTDHDHDHIKQTDRVDKPVDKKEAQHDKVEKEKIVGSEKYGGIYADKKVDAAASTSSASSDNHKVEKEKIVGSEKYGGIYVDKKVGAAATRSDKSHEKVSGSKLNATAKLKVAREQMTKILVLLLVFALGLYVSNLPWFSRKTDKY